MRQEQSDLRIRGVLEVGRGQQSMRLGQVRIARLVESLAKRIRRMAREFGSDALRGLLRGCADREGRDELVGVTGHEEPE